MKKQDVQISIIVPIYKVEKYLVRCVESLIAQDFSSLEIILIDDGSPDRCGEICDNYAKKDARITAYHKPNGGLSDARNYGLERAHGEYVLFVDSDDYLEPGACASLWKEAQALQISSSPKWHWRNPLLGWHGLKRWQRIVFSIIVSIAARHI